MNESADMVHHRRLITRPSSEEGKLIGPFMPWPQAWARTDICDIWRPSDALHLGQSPRSVHSVQSPHRVRGQDDARSSIVQQTTHPFVAVMHAMHIVFTAACPSMPCSGVAQRPL